MKFDVKEIFRKAEDFLRENRKSVSLLVLMVILLFCIQFFRESAKDGIYITGKDGFVTAVRREGSKEMTVPLRIKAVKDGKYLKEDVSLSLKDGNGGKEKSAESAETEDVTQELKQQIKETVRLLENSDGEMIILPKKSDDGSKLFWKKGKNTRPVATLFLLPLGILFLYRSKAEKVNARRESERQSVMRALPGFNNQLLLLLDSGMIFSDAFYRITGGYKMRENQDYFAYIMSDVENRSRQPGYSIIGLLSEYAGKLQIREFSRLVTIISDNQYKGVNLTEKLKSESELLWNQRKKQAEERGKITETKLSFPLTILLIVLILVTSAPAVLQI